MFEEAGVAGVNIEDQVSPKRCGHMPGKDVIPLEEMVKKIEAACLARRDDNFVIVARTDALAVEGIEGAARRARSEEHTSELQSLMRISYAVFCLKNKKTQYDIITHIRVQH